MDKMQAFQKGFEQAEMERLDLICTHGERNPDHRIARARIHGKGLTILERYVFDLGQRAGKYEALEKTGQS